jgi:uncharacterized protein (TIGR02996 family)
VGSFVKEILELLERGDGPAALDALLAIWRDRRAPGIAALIEQLGAALPRPAGDWDELEARRNAADVDALLQSLRDDLLQTTTKRSTPLATTEARIGKLISWPADPRIGAFAESAFRATRSGGSYVFWRALWDLVAQASDPRSGELVERELRRARRSRHKGAPRQAEALRRPIELPAAAEDPPGLDAVARAIGSLGAHTRRKTGADAEEELLAAIVDRWDDDGPKLVYADWLLERGGDRARHGELIALQCKKKRDHAREKELLADLAPILGPVAGVVKRTGLKFEKGFLVEIAGLSWKGQQAKVAGHPAWMTVRRIVSDYGGDDAVFFAHPILRALRVVEEASWTAFAAICAAPHPTRVESIAYYNSEDDEANPPDAVRAGAGAPKLRRVSRRGDLPMPRALLDSPVIRRLEVLEAVARVTTACPLPGWLDLLESLKHPVENFEYRDHPVGDVPVFRFGRDDYRVVWITFGMESGLRPLEAIADRIDRVRLTSKEMIREVREALGGRPVEVIPPLLR